MSSEYVNTSNSGEICNVELYANEHYPWEIEVFLSLWNMTEECYWKADQLIKLFGHSKLLIDIKCLDQGLELFTYDNKWQMDFSFL